MRIIRVAFLVLLFCFDSLASAQNRAPDEPTIHFVCKSAADQVILINQKLYFVVQGRLKNINMEALRETHALAMREALDSAQKVFENTPTSKRTETVDFFMKSASAAYKYGLCQRYRRPDTKAETLSTEYYFMCRKESIEGISMEVDECF